MHYSATKGPAVMNLDPQPGTHTFGRTLFRIHGDNAAHVGESSDGCIVLGPHLRHMIGTSGDDMLEVQP